VHLYFGRTIAGCVVRTLDWSMLLIEAAYERRICCRTARLCMHWRHLRLNAVCTCVIINFIITIIVISYSSCDLLCHVTIISWPPSQINVTYIPYLKISLYGHIETADQRTNIQQYGDRYTGRWWGCYIWYSEEGPGRAAAPPRPILAVPNVTARAPINGQCTNYNYSMRHYNCLCTPKG